jgi:hypothetical protein
MFFCADRKMSRKPAMKNASQAVRQNAHMAWRSEYGSRSSSSPALWARAGKVGHGSVVIGSEHPKPIAEDRAT